VARLLARFGSDWLAVAVAVLTNVASSLERPLQHALDSGLEHTVRQGAHDDHAVDRLVRGSAKDEGRCSAQVQRDSVSNVLVYLRLVLPCAWP